MLGGAKVLVAFVGGFAGITGFSSLSSLEWDPSNVWRVSSKTKFPLFTCRQKSKLTEKQTNQAWQDSELLVYLTFKNGVSTLTDSTELVLNGKGSFKKGRGWKNEKSVHNQLVDLQEKMNDIAEDSRFVLTVNKDSKRNRLGESGTGTDVYEYGSMVYCDKSLFAFDTYNELRGDSWTDWENNVGLKNVQFFLKDCQTNKYDSKYGCSIEIKSGNKGLKWANGFDPIVIQ
ncbi:hypothetical protein WEN_03005 [Mycoplasma wenyonii str. Massachusetts]|uniref:Uncharacterized protein n=1 Tax=Mycoplasma wenyonii (strain Massachusetts) TaxID=1197325 RepID=I6YM57_MYCWM|nr:hypothetical protein [Mycoplasma wenyonii]AFN65384.1 hypothetical protein WEN_03005 [Mycoplasma wenyonii str. Massachusetts]